MVKRPSLTSTFTLLPISKLRRLGIVESSVADTREDVGAIKSVFAHLATKADVNELKSDVSAIKATLPHLATKAEVEEIRAEIRAAIAPEPAFSQAGSGSHHGPVVTARWVARNLSMAVSSVVRSDSRLI